MCLCFLLYNSNWPGALDSPALASWCQSPVSVSPFICSVISMQSPGLHCRFSFTLYSCCSSLPSLLPTLLLVPPPQLPLCLPKSLISHYTLSPPFLLKAFSSSHDPF